MLNEEQKDTMQEDNSLYYSELAIASLTLGVISFVQLFGLEKSIAAIVFGILALRRIKEDQTKSGKRLAQIGLVFGIIYSAIAFAVMPHAIQMVKNMMSTTQ